MISTMIFSHSFLKVGTYFVLAVERFSMYIPDHKMGLCNAKIIKIIGMASILVKTIKGNPGGPGLT